ncbi:hypothetical protein Tco_1576684 [Tanacetum coccineum]
MLTRAKLMYYCQPNSFYSIGTNSVTNEIEPNLMVLDLILHCSADLVNMDYADLSIDVESTKLHTPLDNSATDGDVDFIDAEDDVAHDIENFDDRPGYSKRGPTTSKALRDTIKRNNKKVLDLESE